MAERVDVAVIGCGAVATSGYLPACRRSETVRVVRVVDVDADRAREVAGRFDVPGYASDHQQALDGVDAAIVTTPPAFHAPIATDCFERGVHVLCEKPLATASAEAAEAVEAAERAGVHYAVTRHRREVPSLRLVKRLLDDGFLGEVSSIEILERRELVWRFASSYRFDRTQSWGGTLADLGPYAFDLLSWYVGDDVEIDRYHDDSLGGVEANVELEATVGAIPAVVTLSDTRSGERLVRVHGERGRLEAGLPSGDLGIDSVGFEPDGPRERLELRFGSEDAGPMDWVGWIQSQIDRFAESIRTDEVRYAPASAGVRIVEAIETCYAMREPSPHPWEVPAGAPGVVGSGRRSDLGGQRSDETGGQQS